MSHLQMDKMDRNLLYRDVNKTWDRANNTLTRHWRWAGRWSTRLFSNETNLDWAVVRTSLGSHGQVTTPRSVHVVAGFSSWVRVVVKLVVSCRVTLVVGPDGNWELVDASVHAFHRRCARIVVKLIVSCHPRSRIPDGNWKWVEAA